MPAWTLLFESEVRRARRYLRRVAEANPVFAIALLLGVLVSLWLSWDAGRQIGSWVASVPGAVSIEGVSIMLSTGILAALVTSGAPGPEQFDEQLQAAPLARWEFNAGLIAVPCTIVWLLSSLYGAAFGYGLIAGAGLSSPAAGASQIMFGGIGAASIVATLSSAVRQRRLTPAIVASLSMCLIAIALPILAARLDGSTYPLTWLAAFLPDPGRGYSSPVLVAGLSLGVPALAYAAWLLIESQPRRARETGAHVSVPIPVNLPAALTVSYVLASFRVRPVRDGFIAALAIAASSSLLYRFLFPSQASMFAPLISVIGVMLAAAVACSATGDILVSEWIWATSTRSRMLLGVAWWVSTAIGSALLVAVVVAPGVLLLGGEGIRVAVLMGLLAASLVGPVSKLFPWRNDSLSSQVVASFVLLWLLLGSMQVVSWTAERVHSDAVGLATICCVAAADLGATVFGWRRAP
jgi:hypothetical protein